MEKKYCKIYWKYFIAFLAFFISGCESKEVGRQKELCKKSAGLFINKTVYDNGYYEHSTNCRGCWQYFVENTKYDYLEICNDDVLERYYPDGGGCWKVYRSNIKDVNCNLQFSDEKKYFWKKKNPSIKDDFCVAFKKIEKPESKYEYLVADKLIDGKKDKDPFVVETTWLVKIANSDDILASQVDYNLYVWNKFSGGYVATGCGDLTSNGSKIDFQMLEKIILEN